MKKTKYRGKCVDNNEWIYGHYTVFADGDHCILNGYIWESVIPETVGQLRYEKDGVEYYDDDVYYQAGYGKVRVSDICHLQFTLYVGESQDIEHIIGNIHDNPELLIP